jgi:hypothetical protein
MCDSTVTRNHTNIVLPIKVKLITMVLTMWEGSYPVHKDCKYKNYGGKNINYSV